MNFEELNAVSNTFIAVSTVLGVAGALGYYFSQVIGFSLYWLFILEILYFILIFIIVSWVRRKVKYEKNN